MEMKNHKPKGNKNARIIVRNLPFKNLTEEKIREWFGKYGTIEEVKLLKKDDGKFIGCGFIQFAEIENAKKAIQEGNEKQISGRKIIIDWAVPKKLYVEHLKVLKVKEEEDEYVEEKYSECDKKLPCPANRLSNTCESANSDNKIIIKKDLENTKNFSFCQGKKIKKKSNDVQLGKTIFIRNLPFSATNEDLRKCFSIYGEMEYALVCFDKVTEHSKGTGFVKFKDKACAEYCLTQNNKLFIDDSPLLLSPAESKEDLIVKKQKKPIKDSRNLYLSKEGLIIAGSAAANGVSASDMAKRLEIEQYKSQALKNLNMFVSQKRLIIYNLPPAFDETQLKALFLKFTHPKAVINEARVMRDKKNIDVKTGLGVSKEYGFVTFSTHEDALLALRNINNNPKVFSVKKRPIVSFSIESKAALNVRKKRLQKSRIKLNIDESSKLMKLTRKQRRFIKRKEKIIRKRQERKGIKDEVPQDKTETKKRKIEDDLKVVVKNKKQKISNKKPESQNTQSCSEYCGVVSEPGTKVKLRSRLKLRNQARIHKQQLKEEKLKQLKTKKAKLEKYKQPKQKQVKKIIKDDPGVGRIITKHKKALDKAASFKKWDE